MEEPIVSNLVLLAGVFVDPITGDMNVKVGPNVNPVIVFCEAIKAMEIGRMQQTQKGPQILRAAGPVARV